MSFSITITGQSATELFANLQAAAGATGAVKVTKTTQKGAAAAAAEAPLPTIETAPKPTEPAAATATDPAGSTQSPTSAPAPAASTPTLEEEVRALLTPLLRDPDTAPQVAELMATFGATKLSKIPADKLPEVLAAAKLLPKAGA